MINGTNLQKRINNKPKAYDSDWEIEKLSIKRKTTLQQIMFIKSLISAFKNNIYQQISNPEDISDILNKTNSAFTELLNTYINDYRLIQTLDNLIIKCSDFEYVDNRNKYFYDLKITCDYKKDGKDLSSKYNTIMTNTVALKPNVSKIDVLYCTILKTLGNFPQV